MFFVAGLVWDVNFENFWLLMGFLVDVLSCTEMLAVVLVGARSVLARVRLWNIKLHRVQMRCSYTGPSPFVQLVLEALHARLKSLDVLFLLDLSGLCPMFGLELGQLHILQLQLLREHCTVAFELMIILRQTHHFLSERFILNRLLILLISILLCHILSTLIARSPCLFQILLLLSI